MIGGAAPILSLTTTGGTTNINGGAVTTVSDQSYDTTTIATSAATLTGANVTFTSTVTGLGLTVNSHGVASFNGAASTANLTTIGGATAINGTTVTTTGNQSYDATTIATSAATLTAPNVTFNSTVTGLGLTVNTTAAATFDGTVTTARLTTGTTGSVSLQSVETASAQIYNNPTVTLNGDYTTTNSLFQVTSAPTTLAGNSTVSTGSGNITFDNTINGAFALTVESSGTITFASPVGGTTALTTLTTAGGTTDINGGSMTTTGDQDYNDNVVLGVATNFNAGGSLNFGGTVTQPAGSTGGLSIVGGAQTQQINLSGATVPVTLEIQATSSSFNPTLIGGQSTNTFIKTANEHVNETIVGGGPGSTNNFQVVPNSAVTLVSEGGTNVIDLSAAGILVLDKSGNSRIIGVDVDLSQTSGQQQLVYQQQLTNPDIGSLVDPSVLPTNNDASLGLQGKFQTVIVGSGATLYAAPSTYDPTTGQTLAGSTIILNGTGDTVYGADGATIKGNTGGNNVIQNFNATTASAFLASGAQTYYAANPNVLPNLFAISKNQNLLFQTTAVQQTLISTSTVQGVLATNPIVMGALQQSDPTATTLTPTQSLLMGNSNVENVLLGSAAVQQVLLGSAAVQQVLLGSAAVQQVLLGSAAVQQVLLGSATVQQVLLGSATVQQVLLGSATVQQVLLGSATVQQVLLGSATVQQVLLGSATVQQVLLGSATVQQVLLGSATVQQVLLGSATVQQVLLGSATVQQVLLGSAAVQQVLLGSAAVQQVLLGSAAVQQVLLNDPTVQALLASATLQQLVQGNPAVQQMLLGSATVQQILLGSATVQQVLLGSAAVQQVLLGSATVQQVLLGSATVQQVLLGSATVQQVLLGSATVQQVLLGSATVQHVLLGSASVQLVLLGSATVQQVLLGSATVQQVLLGSATVQQVLLGSATVTQLLFSDPTVQQVLLGDSTVRNLIFNNPKIVNLIFSSVPAVELLLGNQAVQQLIVTNPSLLQLFFGNPTVQNNLLLSPGVLQVIIGEPAVLDSFFANNSTVLNAFLSDPNNKALVQQLLNAAGAGEVRLNVTLTGTGNSASGGLLSTFDIGSGGLFTEDLTTSELFLANLAVAAGIPLNNFQLHVTADGGNNVFVGGTMGNFTANGGGNNRFVIEDPSLIGVNAGTTLPTQMAPFGGTFAGSGGNDSFYFVGGNAGYNFGNVTLNEPTNASPTDTLDFSNYTGGGVNLSLATTAAQTVTTGVMTLTLNNAASVLKVIGSPAADSITGNALNNVIQGSALDPTDPYALAAVPPAVPPTQWVYLDFNAPNIAQGVSISQWDLSVVNSTVQANIEAAILAGLQNIYAPFNNLTLNGQTYNLIQFTDNLTTNPIPANTPYETVYFDVTPIVNGIASPGGQSNEIDFRNLNQNTSMIVDINGFLGAGVGLVPDTEPDYENLSVTVIAHELGHTLGLRHEDAFGPIGFGISNPPGINEYYPAYPGLIGAFSTDQHVITSPAAVGSTLAEAADGEAQFGDREAISLAFIYGGTVVDGTNAPLTGTVTPNSNTITNLSSTTNLFLGEPFTGKYIPAGATITQINVGSSTVPASITLSSNVLSSATAGTETFTTTDDGPFAVTAAKTQPTQNVYVVNEAELTSTTSTTIFPQTITAQPVSLYNLAVPNPITSGFDAGQVLDVDAVDVLGHLSATNGPDYYTFQGTAGDLMNFETKSAALTRLTNPIDTVIYVYAPETINGKLSYVEVAWNDDQFEPSDSSIIDFTLPTSGTYIVEVDSFQHADGQTATSGDYELFMYRYAAFNATSGNDTLIAGTGNDTLIGGTGNTTFVLNNNATGTNILTGGTGTNTLQATDALGFSLTSTKLTGQGGSATYTNINNVSLTDNGTTGANNSFAIDSSFTGHLTLNDAGTDSLTTTGSPNASLDTITTSVTGGLINVNVNGSLLSPFAVTGGNVGTFNVANSVQGAISVTGNLNTLTVGQDVSSTVGVTGTLGSVAIGGSLTSTGVITAANIHSLTVGLDVNDVAGQVAVTGTLGTANIGGSLTSTGVITSANITSLTVGLNVAGQITVAGTGTLGSLAVGGGVTSTGTIKAGSVTTMTVGLAAPGLSSIPNVTHDLAGQLIVNGTGTLGNLGSLQVAGGVPGSIAVAGNLNTLSVGQDISGTIKVTGGVSTATISGNVTSTGVITSATITSLIVGLNMAGQVTAAGSLGTATIGGSVTNAGVGIQAGSLNTLSVGQNVSGTVTVTGTLSTVTIGGAITNTGVVEAGSITAMTVGGDMAGQIIVNGTGTLGKLGNLWITGGAPGTISAVNIGSIGVAAGYGAIILQVSENGIWRYIEAAPPNTNLFPGYVAPPAGPSNVTFKLLYEGTATVANPQATIRVINRNTTVTPGTFDLRLVTYNDKAKFNLVRLDSANTLSGIGNVSVEGDILTAVSSGAAIYFGISTSAPAGIQLPNDTLGSVAVRDYAPNGEIAAKSIQAVAFGSDTDGTTLQTGWAASATDAANLLASGTAIVQANSTFRVPFADQSTQPVAFFFDSNANGGVFDSNPLKFTVEADVGTPSNVARGAVVALITAVPTVVKGKTSTGVVTTVALLGDGASITTAQAIGTSITSGGSMGDINLSAQLPPLISAASIFGSINETAAAVSGTVKTTGQRTDPITGAVTTVQGDFGAVLANGTTTAVNASVGLTGTISAAGNLLSFVTVNGTFSGTIHANGNIGSINLPTPYAWNSTSSQLTATGGVSISGTSTASSVVSAGTTNAAGTITSVGNIFGPITMNGSAASTVSATGDLVGTVNFNTFTGAVNVTGNLGAIEYASSSGPTAATNYLWNSSNQLVTYGGVTVSSSDSGALNVGGNVYGPITLGGGLSGSVGYTTTSAKLNVGSYSGGQVIIIGNQVGNFTVNGTLAGLVAVQGDVGGLKLTSTGNYSGSATTGLIRYGAFTVNGTLTGAVAVLGNMFSNFNVTGTLSGKVAVQGLNEYGLGARVGMLGQVTIGGSISSTGALVSAGMIGDSTSGTTFSLSGSNSGIIAGVGHVNGPSNLVGTNGFFTDLANGSANLAAVDNVFSNATNGVTGALKFNSTYSGYSGLALLLGELEGLTNKSGTLGG